MRRARTLLVGGNDAFLDGVVDWVAQDAQFEVVGRVHSGSEVLPRIGALKADVVLMDVILPDTSGFEVSRLIKARADAPLVILLSFYDNQAARLEAWAAGADGFVPQSETTTRLKPLVGELLGRRGKSLGEEGSVVSITQVPPPDVSK